MAETIVKEHQVQSHTIIDSLVDSRSKMLTRYKELMNYTPFYMDDTLQEVLEDFCESLVDYTAKAHFNLYSYLDEQKECHQSVLAIADNVYPQLVDNTQKILDFHDSYNNDTAAMQSKNLEACLNSIGELLAERISLEDSVMDALL